MGNENDRAISRLTGIHQRISLALQQHYRFFAGAVIVLLLSCALFVVTGIILNLAYPRDVGYPDSANLLRISEFLQSGHIYPEINSPPYLVTLYGPMTYVLLGIPFSLARAIGLSPDILVRLAEVGTLSLCVLFVFLISRSLYASRLTGWLCCLFALSATYLASWGTQVRGDLQATAFSLSAIWLALMPEGPVQLVGSAALAGLAILTKQTYVAVPTAVVCWHLLSRRYRQGALWAAVWISTIALVYGVVLWREPLLIEHLAALGHPLFEYKGAVKILGDAALQPVVPFAALGAFAWLSGRDSRKLQFAMYALVSWLVAIITIPQVGGGMNYFQEPLLVSSVLAGAGLIRLQQSVQRTPALVALALMVLLLRAFLPVFYGNVTSLRGAWSYVDPKAYATRTRKREWNSFVAMLSGRRLLSTLPDVAVHSTTPEIPDPYLNTVLEIRGIWNSAPVAARIDADVYDLIVLRKGEAAGRVEFYRGLPRWNDKMWRALLRAYKPFCEFENMEVWLPDKRPSPVISQLSTVGCHPGAGPLVDYGDPTVQFQ